MNNSRFNNSTKGQYDITIVKKIGVGDSFKYKLIHLNYLKNSGIEDNQIFEKSKKCSVNDIKLYENISRAKNNIIELAYCNNWQWFFTGTLDKNKYNREDLEKFHKDITRFFRNFVSNNNLNSKIDFILIPELHSDGKSWHMHGLLNGLDIKFLTEFKEGMTMSKHILEKIRNNEKVYKWQAYENKFGFNDIEEIKNHEAVSNYISKYISKELGHCVTELNAHLYYHSRGLNKAQVIKKGRMNWYNDDNQPIQPDYKRRLLFYSYSLTRTI